MIEINLNKVSKSYGFDKIINDVNLTIKTNEKIALIGPNGCGKSTILKLIAGIENISSGNISIRKGITIGYLSQIPDNIDILVKDYIYDSFKYLIDLKEKLENLEKKLSSNLKVINKYTRLQEEFINLGGYEYETKIKKVISAFSINDEMLERNFNTLSGGEKTIITLIRLLLINPDILLLDEPTNHLDIKKIEWLEDYLSNLKKTVIVVSHDRYFLDKVVNKTILITKRGLEEYNGNYSYFIKENEERILREFKEYKDQQKIINAMKKAIKKLREFGHLCGDSGGEIFYKRALSIEKRLEKMEKIDKPDCKKTINIDFNGSDRSGKDVLKIKNLNISFENKKIFLDASCTLFYKEKVCLIGPNGCGKSTLIKNIINGNNSIVLGSNIKIGYIPQIITFEDDNLTIIEEFRKYFIGDETHLRSTLNKYLFVGENIYKKIKYLSGGEKVRLKLLCLITDKYNFLILDEPTNHIDIDTREVLENSLIDFNGTILFVSHDRYFINKVATHIIIVDNYKLTKYIGNYHDILTIKKTNNIIHS